jgi:hypothetical protein
MTNKEALIATIMVSTQAAGSIVEKVLVDFSIDASATYSAANAKEIDLCAIEVLKGILSTPDISEGGFSVKYDRGAVQARLSALNEKYFPELIKTPTVRARDLW